MPFYEYVCTLCGTEKTILQKISDAPAVDCPACGKPGLTKQISAAGFRLKGGGWYETDFKSDNKKNLAGEGSNGGDNKSVGKDGDKAGDKTPAKTPEKAGDGAAAKPADKATPAPAAASKPAATPPAAT